MNLFLFVCLYIDDAWGLTCEGKEASSAQSIGWDPQALDAGYIHWRRDADTIRSARKVALFVRISIWSVETKNHAVQTIHRKVGHGLEISKDCREGTYVGVSMTCGNRAEGSLPTDAEKYAHIVLDIRLNHTIIQT